MNLINQVTVIAEAGVNHNGDLEMASELIKVAAYAVLILLNFKLLILKI